MEERNKGAWIIHHSNKVDKYNSQQDFEDLHIAGKCGKLLSSLTESNSEATINKEGVEALASANGISKLELFGIQKILVSEQLIDVDSNGNVAVLAVTPTALLAHTSQIFNESNPSKVQEASLHLAEIVAEKPKLKSELKEQLSDTFELSGEETKKLFARVDDYKIVDSDKAGQEQLFFNGNLFRNNSINKVQKVLSSVNSEEQGKINTVSEILDKTGCMSYNEGLNILGQKLFDKLNSIGFYDVSSISNDGGNHYFITKPSAFNKYGDSFVEDALDLAKAFVTSLYYGINQSSPGRGRINNFELLLTRLTNGEEVGPATAIGNDYRMLELKGVIKLRRSRQYPERYFMRLAKKEIGELALQVLKSGEAVETLLLRHLDSNIRP